MSTSGCFSGGKQAGYRSTAIFIYLDAANHIMRVRQYFQRLRSKIYAGTGGFFPERGAVFLPYILRHVGDIQIDSAMRTASTFVDLLAKSS